MCKIKPIGYFVIVKNGYSSMSKLSWFNGVFNVVLPVIRITPVAVVFPPILNVVIGLSLVFKEPPKNLLKIKRKIVN